MAAEGIARNAEGVAAAARGLADQAQALAAQAHAAAATAAPAGEQGFFLTGLTVFVLACFVGYYVVWRVTPALHSPLMSVTNAISSVIVVGALIAAGPAVIGASSLLGALAVLLASVNIFGGFLVTRRMLAMYRKKG
jgi:H+-translocating NAD(P) transhydrogenase subunit alpha